LYGAWNEEFRPLYFVRFDSIYWLKTLLTKGSILFGNAQKWSNLEDTIEGRGDRYEGTLCSCLTNDRYSISRSKLFYHADITEKVKGGITLIKNSNHIALPIFCFYILKDEDFLPVPGDSSQKRAVLSGDVFTGFNNGMTEEEAEALPEDKKPGVLLINKPLEFIDRVIDTLKTIGVKDEEVFFDKVKYFNMRGSPGSVGRSEFPFELYCKDERYRKQKEGRIVVNTADQDVIDRLKYPIEIGSIEDIACIRQWYFTNGIQVFYGPSTPREDGQA